MECEKCGCEHLSIKEQKKLRYDWCTRKYEEYSVLHIKCEQCGHEFIECV